MLSQLFILLVCICAADFSYANERSAETFPNDYDKESDDYKEDALISRSRLQNDSRSWLQDETARQMYLDALQGTMLGLIPVNNGEGSRT